MKICILTETKEWGGTEVHTLGLAETLRGRGHQVVIVQLWHDLYGSMKTNSGKDIDLVNIKLSKSIQQVSFSEWREMFNSLQGDICVFEKGALEPRSRLSLDFAARATFLSYITIEQLTCDPMPPNSSRRHFGGLVPGMGLWWYRILVARHLRSWGPRRIVCVSDFTRKQLIEQYRFPARKMTTIHNGFDASKFQWNPNLRREARSRWGISESALVFGAVARLNEVKGLDIAIELFRELVSKYPGRDMRLVLVGQGYMEKNLKRQACDAGLENVVLFPGFTEEPWAAYSSFDVFLMPSFNEGLPLALLEAMALGCCPIAMSVGGVPEVITDASVGWLVKAGDRRGFFKAMEWAVRSSRTMLSDMGRRAREHVRSRFNAEELFVQHAKLIETEYAERSGRLPLDYHDLWRTT